MRRVPYILVLWVFWVAGPSSMLVAQETLQVVTHTIEQRFAFRQGMEVGIEAEKAELRIRAWEESRIQVELSIIAQHPEQAVAATSIERMQYEMKQEGLLIQLGNAIERVDGQLPPAQLKALYEIRLPAQCPVYVHNAFGTVEVSDLVNESEINGEFCRISLDNLKGTIIIDTYYGDVEGNLLEGNIRIDATHSDITLRGMSGHFDIKATYSLMRLYATEELNALFVDATQSDVELSHPDLGGSQYMIAVSNGQIVAPNFMDLKFLENTPSYKRARHLVSRELPQANIRLSVSYGDVHLYHQ